MALDWLGPPQVAALLVLAQRGLEEIYSARNTSRLLAEGAHEEGGELYPMVAAVHLGWIAAIGLLLPANATIYWPTVVGYVSLQVVRYWIIASLGRFWTHRIITLPGAPIVRRGPYAFIRHPNYAVTIAETAVLPMAFGAAAISVIFAALWITVIRVKIAAEDRALSSRLHGRPA